MSTRRTMGGLTLFTGILLGLASQACTVTECKEGDDCGFGGNGSGGGGTPGPVGIESLGSETIDPDGTAEVTVSVPSGAPSFALVVQGAGSELVIADKITSPSGTVVFDFDADIATNRTDATDGLYTVLVPTNPAVAVEEGDWLINLRSGSNTFEGDLTSVIKRQPATDNLLDLNLYFVGLPDTFDPAADTRFQSVLTNVGAIYQGAGFNVRSINSFPITGGDGDTYGVIDSEAELKQLFQLSPSESNISLNLFFVNDISFGGSLSIVGLAGGVPGPPALQGTERSGVAASMGSYLAALEMGDMELLETAAQELEIIIAHETGHFLGLYHTVERNGLALGMGDAINGEDPLADTATCPDSADANMDGLLSPTECAGQGASNLMFWSPANDARTLTGNQGTIMLANPLVH